MSGLKPGPISKARARAKAEAKAKITATANTEILSEAQNDGVWWVDGVGVVWAGWVNKREEATAKTPVGRGGWNVSGGWGV